MGESDNRRVFTRVGTEAPSSSRQEEVFLAIARASRRRAPSAEAFSDSLMRASRARASRNPRAQKRA